MLLRAHRTRLSARLRLTLPDDRAINVLFDKQETRALAQRLGIPVTPACGPRPGGAASGVFAEFGVP